MDVKKFKNFDDENIGAINEFMIQNDYTKFSTQGIMDVFVRMSSLEDDDLTTEQLKALIKEGLNEIKTLNNNMNGLKDLAFKLANLL
jgi:hypothetical protein